LSNAVKFTPEGGSVHLEAMLVCETEGSCVLRIEVTDSGIGISPDMHDRLFGSFEQAEKGTSRQYGGTGLGLSISKHIVEMMGGNIWIESELGKGSKFIFTINAIRHNQNPQSAIKAECAVSMGEFGGKKLLVVEDIEINREIIIALLADTGLSIDCAENGQEAFDMVSADPDKYDIVFMDVQMPVMNGHEATRRIRALPDRPRGRLPIIAMTANVIKSEIDECLAVGMDSHVGKPIDIDIVIGKLREFLERR
jgi:CheY-like chemotaxis protein